MHPRAVKSHLRDWRPYRLLSLGVLVATGQDLDREAQNTFGIVLFPPLHMFSNCVRPMMLRRWSKQLNFNNKLWIFAPLSRTMSAKYYHLESSLKVYERVSRISISSTGKPPKTMQTRSAEAMKRTSRGLRSEKKAEKDDRAERLGN